MNLSTLKLGPRMSDVGDANPENAESPVPNEAMELTDEQEILLRHIRKAWYDNGVASSQNFEPMPKDRCHLSLERGSMIEAPAAHARWTAWGRDSVAVFGVEVGTYQSNGAPTFHVPVISPPEEQNPEHALARYPDVRSQSSRLAKKIKTSARKIYEP